ncbi:hypothetical protein [Tardiphaga sp.]|uniref:hypothetical protein n=1 Tax=Tardiphaga sp. TaxID=1926292 RepID=UPI002639FC12|nr:hypothetical protein [Tardiphaga sp.]MDB5617880.1 hypothetical protein [Tardiphaga sp.]
MLSGKLSLKILNQRCYALDRQWIESLSVDLTVPIDFHFEFVASAAPVPVFQKKAGALLSSPVVAKTGAGMSANKRNYVRFLTLS